MLMRVRKESGFEAYPTVLPSYRTRTVTSLSSPSAVTSTPTLARAASGKKRRLRT